MLHGDEVEIFRGDPSRVLDLTERCRVSVSSVWLRASSIDRVAVSRLASSVESETRSQRYGRRINTWWCLGRVMLMGDVSLNSGTNYYLSALASRNSAGLGVRCDVGITP